jgi:hypothetical protein
MIYYILAVGVVVLLIAVAFAGAYHDYKDSQAHDGIDDSV